MNFLISGLMAALTTTAKVVAAGVGLGTVGGVGYAYKNAVSTPEALEDKADSLRRCAERKREAEAKAEARAEERFWNGIFGQILGKINLVKLGNKMFEEAMKASKA